MFSLFKAVVGVIIETPIAVIADVVTLGGVLTDTNKPYTVTSVEKVMKNVSDSTK